METGLLGIQAGHLREFRQTHQVLPAAHETISAMFGRADSSSYDRNSASHSITNAAGSVPSFKPNAIDPTVELARCFLRLADLPNFALDRLSRYEASLWRQVRQILYALNALDRRRPQERTHHFRFDGNCPELA